MLLFPGLFFCCAHLSVLALLQVGRGAGKRGGAEESRIAESVFRQRRWQTGSLILENNISSDRAFFFRGETLTFHPQHVRTGSVPAEVSGFGASPEYPCSRSSSRALGNALNLHHLSEEGPDLMSSIPWSVAVPPVNHHPSSKALAVSADTGTYGCW